MTAKAAKTLRLTTRAERIDAAIKHLESVHRLILEKRGRVIPFPGPYEWKRP